MIPSEKTLEAFRTLPPDDRELCTEWIQRLESSWGSMAYREEMEWNIRVLQAMFRGHPFTLFFAADWRATFDALPGSEAEFDNKERSAAIENNFRDFHDRFEFPWSGKS